jgi:MFS family permease
MGIKAVSTPILASETAVGFWRGTAILAWQLWVAFGIMMGFIFNLIFEQASRKSISLGLVQGAPMVPAIALLIMAAFFCPESPRYHLMKGPNYSPEKAFKILCQLRNTELQALRDMYAVYKSIEQENIGMNEESHANQSPGFWWTIRDFFMQFKQLFQQRRLYNALISAGTVNLAQQLCGVNVFAFYSGELFSNAGAQRERAMAYSLGFGAINFVFALPAVRSIDTLGRRRWLLMTLPFMALFMLGAALSFSIDDPGTRTGIVALFLFCKPPFAIPCLAIVYRVTLLTYVCF